MNDEGSGSGFLNNFIIYIYRFCTSTDLKEAVRRSRVPSWPGQAYLPTIDCAVMLHLTAPLLACLYKRFCTANTDYCDVHRMCIYNATLYRVKKGEWQIELLYNRWCWCRGEAASRGSRRSCSEPWPFENHLCKFVGPFSL